MALWELLWVRELKPRPNAWNARTGKYHVPWTHTEDYSEPFLDAQQRYSHKLLGYLYSVPCVGHYHISRNSSSLLKNLSKHISSSGGWITESLSNNSLYLLFHQHNTFEVVALAFATMKYIAAQYGTILLRLTIKTGAMVFWVFSIVNYVNANLLDPKASALNVQQLLTF